MISWNTSFFADWMTSFPYWYTHVQAPRVYHAVDRMTSPVFDDRIASHGTSAVRSRW